MIDVTFDIYDITMKYIVPGMLVLSVLGILLYQMGDTDIFGSVGNLVLGSGLSLP